VSLQVAHKKQTRMESAAQTVLVYNTPLLFASALPVNQAILT